MPAGGLGWSVRRRRGRGRRPTAAAGGRAGRAAAVHFDGAVPAGRLAASTAGAYGRLGASPTGPRQGNAVYDEHGMPVWAAADGLGFAGGSGKPLDTGSVGLRGAEVALQGDGSLAVTHGADAVVLRGVGVVRFADGRLVFDADPPSGARWRAYTRRRSEGADQGGLNVWTEAVEAGRPLADFAEGFLASGVRPRFGDMADNGAFVDRMYQNVLGRAGEPKAAALGERDQRRHRAAPTSWSASRKAPRTRHAPPPRARRHLGQQRDGGAGRPAVRHRARPAGRRRGVAVGRTPSSRRRAIGHSGRRLHRERGVQQPVRESEQPRFADALYRQHARPPGGPGRPRQLGCATSMPVPHVPTRYRPSPRARSTST